MSNPEAGIRASAMNRDAKELGPETINNPDEARERIHQLYEKGERPIVSVPLQYADALAKGLAAHTTWIPELSVVVGTLGRDPYIPRGEERFLVRVELDDENQIEPRFTGPSHSFQGVVVLRGPIPPERIRALR